MPQPYRTRAQILPAIIRREADYPLADGSALRIRELMAEDRLEAQRAGDADPETFAYRNVGAFYAILALRGIFDGPNGQPLFTEADLPALSQARTPIRGLSLRLVGDAIWQLSEADQNSFRSDADGSDELRDADPDVRAATGPGTNGDEPGAVRPDDAGAAAPDGAGYGAGPDRAGSAAPPDLTPVDTL